MLWETFFSAIALVLVFEGMLPFISPQTWREWVLRVARGTDQHLRSYGLVSMLLGVALLFIIHNFF